MVKSFKLFINTDCDSSNYNCTYFTKGHSHGAVLKRRLCAIKYCLRKNETIQSCDECCILQLTDYRSVVQFSLCNNPGTFGGKILKSLKLLGKWYNFSSVCICRSLVPQIWHLWIRLVSYQAEHRLQVSHSLETQAAWSESGCQELLQTYTSHFR